MGQLKQQMIREGLAWSGGDRIGSYRKEVLARYELDGVKLRFFKDYIESSYKGVIKSWSISKLKGLGSTSNLILAAKR